MEQKNSNYINYNAVVKSDANEYKEFTDEEIIITQYFEDSIKRVKLKYFSHKNQKKPSKGEENFEFKFEKE